MLGRHKLSQYLLQYYRITPNPVADPASQPCAYSLWLETYETQFDPALHPARTSRARSRKSLARMMSPTLLSLQASSSFSISICRPVLECAIKCQCVCRGHRRLEATESPVVQLSFTFKIQTLLFRTIENPSVITQQTHSISGYLVRLSHTSQ